MCGSVKRKKQISTHYALRPEVISMGFWSYCFGWKRLDIRPGDLVLEVGPGQKPMIRSDVLVDKFLTDDTERGGDW